MTVSNTQVRVSYTGDGTSKSFSIPFPFYLSTDIMVLLAGAQQSSGYSISGGEDASGNPQIGTCTFSTAPASGANVQLVLNVPLTQLVDLVDGTAFPSATINQVNDRGVQAALRLNDLIGRSIRAPDGDSSPSMLLPNAATRANKGLMFDGNGNPTPGTPTTMTPQSVTFTGTASDITNLLFQRGAAYSGGTVGFVNSCLKVETDVTGTGVTAYEWAFLGVLKNSATAGNGVAVYGQGNAETGAGPTWAGVFENRDQSGNASPTGGRIGIEVDIFADGADANSQRVGIDVVGGVGVSSGPTITYGVRIGPQNGTTTNCNFLNGLYAYGVITRGINLSLASGSAIGIDISGSTLSGAAIRLGQGQFLSFDTNDTNRFKNDGSGLGYYGNSSLNSRLNADGSLQLNAGNTPPAGGATSIGLKLTSTANLGLFVGSGAPGLSAAQGSLYLRTDGSSTSTRLYVNTNGSNGWTNFTSAT